MRKLDKLFKCTMQLENISTTRPDADYVWYAMDCKTITITQSINKRDKDKRLAKRGAVEKNCHIDVSNKNGKYKEDASFTVCLQRRLAERQVRWKTDRWDRPG